MKEEDGRADSGTSRTYFILRGHSLHFWTRAWVVGLCLGAESALDSSGGLVLQSFVLGGNNADAGNVRRIAGTKAS